MPRTAEEIEEIINTEAEKYEVLAVLQSNNSRVGFWVYVKKVVAFVALTLEKIFEKHKIEINEIIDKTEIGSIYWYLQRCYEYQHGDSLLIENNRPVYANINKEKQIIKRAALKEETRSSLLFKVAKEENGVLERLSNTELASLTTYMNRIKIAGTKLDIQSLTIDVLDIQAEVILDSLLFNTNGKLLSDEDTEPVFIAIENHLRVFDFGGTFYLSKLIDSVMNTEGVKDFFVSSATLNDVDFNRSIESSAGYIRLKENIAITYVLS